MGAENILTAYKIYEHVTVGLKPAPIDRGWMDAAHQRHPYRCLPLNIANQNGWFLTSPTTFEVYWYGGVNPKDLEVRFIGHPDPIISSHFGSAVLTFSIPYLFRTPEGVNLWVKGPSNWIKDGVQALEGVVETDWASSTFTMNWKVTRAFEWIRFEKDDPICMIVPIPRGFAELITPRLALLNTNPELNEQYKKWEEGRRGFLQGLRSLDPEVVKRGWQKDYFQGKTGDGGTFDGHQTRLDVKDFTPEPKNS
ncbi:DUF6065 family protein [Fimbriiglobus ruber]|uniref:Uncharacterized protein n=1 Tax=Fimbriiglobus ruber TaxID=1908690 RepID=A0A225DQK7_9BACT|nr:DUF6065 family protein [Fimbriiglobus ruber]OWK38645.1 hypothetical protein FRUB_07765 [Fimbriiglobus ruber]